MTRETHTVELDEGSPEVQRARAKARARLFGDEHAPARIGRYVIIERVGAGAMGVVYAAYDPQLDRKVALKLLRRDRGSGEAATRMLREARAMAKLSHPNVVTVYEVDTFDDQAFIAMEFINAPTLRVWLSRERRSWRDIVDAFVEAGRGLAAAHRAKLVHRDFKPDNIMVGDNRVVVTDFGLARRAAEPMPSESLAELRQIELADTDFTLTRTGTLVGTPAYMSPEQHRGEMADARSDQFSFCVALFEALTGERPFAGNNVADLMCAVIDGTRSNVTISDEVPAAIREAIDCGLRSEPADRHHDMDDLLAVLAPQRPHRGRLPWVLVAAASIIAAVALTIAVSSSSTPRTAVCTADADQLDGVWDASRRDAVTGVFARTTLPYKAHASATVSKTLDDYAARWQRTHRRACIEARVQHTQSVEVMELRMACLERRRQALDATVAVLTKADESVLRRAVPLVESLPSLELCSDVAALKQGVVPPTSTQQAEQVQRVRMQIERARAAMHAGQYDGGLAAARKAVDAATATDYVPVQVEALLVQGMLETHLARGAEAETTLNKVVELTSKTRQLREAAKASVWLVRAVGATQARYAEAVGIARGARIALNAANAGPADIAKLHQVQSRVAYQAGKIADAKRSVEAALRVQERDPHAPATARADSHHMLAAVLLATAKYKRALEHATRALELRRQALGAGHLEVGRALTVVGAAYLMLGKFAQAERFHRRGIAMLRRALGRKHPAYLAALTNLGNTYLELKRYKDAHATFSEAATGLRDVAGGRHPHLVVALTNLGSAAHGLERPAEAKRHWQAALALMDKGRGDKHPHYSIVLSNLAQIASDEGDYARAQALFTRVLALKKRAYGENHPRYANTLLEMGQLAVRERRLDKALRLYARALAIRRATLGDTHPLTADLLWEMGLRERDRGRIGPARRYLERAKAAGKQGGAIDQVLAGR